MPIYVYELNNGTTKAISDLNRFIPGTITSISAGNPQTVTIDTLASNKDDLDEVMAARGFAVMASEATVALVARHDWGTFTTANEPTVNINAGDTGFDTTLGAFVFYTGAAWSAITNTVSSVLYWGASGIQATTTTRFLAPGFDPANAPTITMQLDVPRAGTIQNMFVRCRTATGNGNDVVYTARINSVGSALAVTLASNVTNGSDTVNTVAVSQGDSIDIEVTKALSIGSSPDDIMVTIEIV